MVAPAVSVIMPAFNHAPFVAQAIESVLQQDFSDFELLVADDGSADGTAEVVRGVSDPRVKLFAHSANRGAGIVTRELIERSVGRYIALINSDDMWLPGKLSVQVGHMETHPELGAVFGKARFMNGRGEGIPKADLPFGTVFDQKNRSQGLWLRHFFTKGNCICHPTMLIKRDLYEELGVYDNRLRQLPDFDMWVRLVKRYPIFIHDVSMVNFRIESLSVRTQ